jgi:hypothetical protein
MRFAYRALDPDQEYPELEQFMADVCDGKHHTWWTQYRRPGDRLIPRLTKLTAQGSLRREYHRMSKFLQERPALRAAARRPEPLVKCIRANLMLNWLSHRHDWKIVLLVRHPGAVVESQYRLRRGRLWDPEPVLQRYRNDSCLHEMTNDRYRKLLSRPLSAIEALTLNWIIENQWVIEQADHSKVTVVYYERLKASPASEWQRMCRTLDVLNVPSASLIERPSQQSSGDGVAGTDPQNNEQSRWQRSLTSEQSALIQAVLDETGFSGYHVSRTEPSSTRVAGETPSMKKFSA